MDNLTPLFPSKLIKNYQWSILRFFSFPIQKQYRYDTLFLVNSALLTCYFTSIALSITVSMPSFLNALFGQIPLQNYVGGKKKSVLIQRSPYCRLSAKDYIQRWHEIIVLDCRGIEPDIFFSQWFDTELKTAKYFHQNSTKIQLHKETK